MTIDTFKVLSLSAKTQKAKEIRKYYVKLEKIVQETLEEQAEEHRKQISIKDKIIDTYNSIKFSFKLIDWQKGIRITGYY